MPEFSVNAGRYDPYKNFKFRIKWNNQYVAGLSKMSPLKRTTEVIEWREGGDVSSIHKMPGRTRYEPIVLERGVTHDTAFEDWANLVFKYGGAGAEMSLMNFRKDIVIDFFNEQGVKALSYIAHRCWVSEYQALPDLDANAHSVAIQYIKIENEGWERDTAVTEPAET